MKQDLEIAHEARLLPIKEVAYSLGLDDDEIEPYGDYKAKLKLSVLDTRAERRCGHLVLCTAVTPTPAGEGKTTVNIGLSMGLARLGKQVVATLRERLGLSVVRCRVWEHGEQALEAFTARGYGRLPVCMAKTQASLSDDPALPGRPRGWRLLVREARLSAGAGMVVPICGKMTTMPGLPKRPAAEHIDLVDGEIVGLS